MRREDHWRLPAWPAYSPQNRRDVAVPLLISGTVVDPVARPRCPAPVHRVTAPGTRRREPADRDPAEITPKAAGGGGLAGAQGLGPVRLADAAAQPRARD